MEETGFTNLRKMLVRHYSWILGAQMPEYAKFSDGYFYVVLEVSRKHIREEVRKEFYQSEQQWNYSIM